MFVIQETQDQIQALYLPGAIAWADEKFANAWSRALVKFDQEVADGFFHLDGARIQRAADVYLKLITPLLEQYRENMGQMEIDDLVAEVEASMRAQA